MSKSSVVITSKMADKMNKGKRKPNWSETEIACLVQACTDNNSLLVSKMTIEVTNKKKEEFWADTCEKVNSVGLSSREVDEIIKKWTDLKSQAKKKEKNRRREASLTGGGKTSICLTDWEQKIVAILPEETLVGIDGGLDTFQSSSCSKQQACVDEETSSISIGHELEDAPNSPCEAKSEQPCKRRKINNPVKKKIDGTTNSDTKGCGAVLH
ncbi:nuclear apoptosis-inducing factor 1-like isoform X2 [Dreissena polymorpha]|uniref:nuclear apoptosis-inducing factor 1-like isoform X2 n=1 Tax=Dreissena polymorpha TaxID=45954 RepID=UPI002263B41B|nr:nuclear apoptosis-inducing factor 1-like isoform X2 [Dreissena polymorpha]